MSIKDVSFPLQGNQSYNPPMSASATTAEPKTESAAPAIPMINVQVDGEWKQFPTGTRLIEACMQSGSFVPHYCYHPALSSPGNCRMCLTQIGAGSETGNRSRWPSGHYMEPASRYLLRH